MPRADRLFVLVQLLSCARFRSLEELTRGTGTSPRTVYRDLADLEERGIPIERDGGAYRILTTATLRPLPLTDRERMVLAIALDHPGLQRQPSYAGALDQVRRKLATAHALPDPSARVAGPDRSGPAPPQVIDALEEGIRSAHSVSILYVSLTSKQKRWRGIDPWQLVHRSDAWYVLGRCHVHNEARTFRLDRITEVLPIGSAFDAPANFDAEAWFASSWSVLRGTSEEEVVIHFDAEVAPLIEHARHHPREDKWRTEDGTLVYRVPLSHLDEIARWIGGFGGAARAIAPAALIERVHALAAGALAAHAAPARSAAMTRGTRKRRVTGSDSGES